MWRKIGHYCMVCDLYYDLRSQVYSKGKRKGKDLIFNQHYLQERNSNGC